MIEPSQAPSVARAGGLRSVVVHDARIPGAAALAASAGPGATVHAVEGSEDGLAAIARALAAADGPVDALHVLCHGRPGALFLGRGPITAGSLGRAAPDGPLGAMSGRFAPGAEIHLHACEAARGAVGHALVAAVEAATGARVAAAAHPVGPESMGGTWTLAFADASPAASPFAPEARAAFPGLLAQPQIVSVTAEPAVITRDAVGQPYTITILYDQPVTDINSIQLSSPDVTLSAFLQPQFPTQPFPNTVQLNFLVKEFDPDESETIEDVALTVEGGADEFGNPITGVSGPFTGVVSIDIDPAAFVVSIDSTDPDGGAFGAGDTIPITLNFNDEIGYDGTGDFRVILSNGAELAVGAFTGTSLSLDYVVGSAGGSDTDRLDVTDIVFTGGVLAGPSGGDPVAVTDIPLGDGTGLAVNLSDPAIFSVNVAPPAPTDPDLAAEDDTGASDTDNVTSVATGTISGTAEPLTTVIVRVVNPGGDPADPRVLASVPVATDGSWSYTFASGASPDLLEGTNSVTAAVDDGANGPVVSDPLEILLDTTAPALDAVLRETPSEEATNSDTLTFRIRLTEQVSGLDAADFAVTGAPGETPATATVTGFAPDGPLEAVVTVSGGDLADYDGTVGLALAPGATAEDVAGNALLSLPGTVESFLLDNTAPAVAAILRSVPDDELTNADALTFEVTFSEAVDGVDAADFASPGVAADVSVETVSADTYRVTLSGGGVADFDGTVGLALDAGATVSDAAGNAVNPAIPPGTAEAYLLDNTVPVIAAIARNAPAGEETDADALTFEVIFSEAVAGVDAADFASPDVTADISVQTAAADTYLVTLAGGDLPDFNGTVGLGLAATDISDAAGNPLDPALPGDAETYDVVNIVVPEPQPDDLSVDEDGVLDALAPVLLSNDADAARIVSVDDSGLSGTLVFDAQTQALSYTASGFDALPAGATAETGFLYTVENADGTATATAEATITVTGVNDGPSAANDTASTGERTPVTVSVLDNDGDPDDPENLGVVSLGQPTVQGTPQGVAGPGSVEIAPDGLGLRFDPGEDFAGLPEGASAVVTVPYTIEDGAGASAAASVAITVNGENAAPVATDDAATTTEIAPVTLDVLDNDEDEDAGDTLSLAGLVDGSLSVAGPPGITLSTAGFTIVGDQLRFTPGTDFAGLGAGEEAVVSVDYRVEDALGAFDTATARVTVTGLDAARLIAFERASPAEELTNADTLTFAIRFDQAVTGVDAGDFAVTGTTAGASLSGSGASYQLTVSGGNLAGLDGPVGLDVAPGALVLSTNGTPAALSEPPVDEIYELLNSPFGVAAIRREDPDEAVTDADNLTFEVSFEREVTGVDAGDFRPTGGTTAGVTGVSVGAQSALVTLSGGDLAGFEGEVGLALASGATVFDLAGNAVAPGAPAVSEVYTVANTGPQALSILRDTPPDSPTNADELVFAVAFDAPVTGLGPEDFRVDGPGFATISVSGTGASRTVTVAGNALADFDGEVALGFAAGAEFEGTDGVPFAGVAPETVETYTLDNTGPSVLSILRTGGAAELTASDTLSFTVIFDDTVEGVGAGDFDLEGSSTVLSVSVDGAAVTVTASGGDLAGLDGPVTLGLASGATITDALGNGLEPGVPGTVEGYTLDNTGPRAVSITRAAGAAEETSADTLAFTVVFDEPVEGLTAADFEATGTTADASVALALGGTEATVTLSGGDLDALNGTVGLAIAPSPGATDAVGNTLSTAAPDVSETYEVSNTGDIPEPQDIALAVDEDATLDGIEALIPLADGERLVAVNDEDTLGTVSFDEATGALSYTADGQDSLPGGAEQETRFAYTVENADGTASASAEVIVTVAGVNDAPVATDDDAGAIAGETVEIAVLDNDTDVDGPEPLTVGAATILSVDGADIAALAPDALSVSPDGRTLVFATGMAFDALGPGGQATVTAEYTVADDAGGTDTGLIIVTVAADNFAPVVRDDTATTTEAAPVAVAVLANDEDLDGGEPLSLDAIEAVRVAGPDGFDVGPGIVRIDGEAILFDPDGAFDALRPGQSAAVEVDYRASDTFGASGVATARITVEGLNSAPVAQDDVASIEVDSTILVGSVFGNDTDPDAGDTLTVTSFNGAPAGTRITLPDGQGTIEMRADGSYVFDPGPAFDGLGAGETETLSISYTIRDAAGATSGATLDIVVTGSGLDDDVIRGGSTVVPREGNTGLNDIDPGAEAADDLIEGGVGNDLLAGGFGFDTIRGGLGRDTLHGDDDDDLLEGEEDDDHIFGGSGNDSLDGADGNDKLYGEDGADLIEGGGGNDALLGGAGNDSLSGGIGNDNLIGNDGDDLLDGGAGDDGHIGGAGSDRFVFRSNEGTDTIMDFDAGPGGDVLVLDGLAGIGTAADALAAFANGPGGAEASVDGTTIVLAGVAASALSEDDFEVL